MLFRSSGNREEEKCDGKNELRIPLAVLVNESSASASEIFAGAVKDYGIGTIVGTTTYGKGVVQTIQPLTDGSAVKITIAKYFTPKGNDINKKGITPDVEAELSGDITDWAELTHEEDTQLQTALKELEQRAAAMGANAVIGVDIDYEVLGADNGMLMVTASGTAVVVD